MLLKLFLFFVMFGIPACTTIHQPLPLNPPAAQPLVQSIAGIEHVVAKGETLWRISKIYHTDLDDIIRANRISDSTNIVPGQKIIIPTTSSKGIAPEKNFTPLERGDSDFIWPIKGKIITQFRQKSDGVSSKGIDILTEPSQDVLASQNGRVVFVGELIGYGKTVIIEHPDGISTVYCGNSSVNVKTGDDVRQGMAMAKTGPSPRKGTSLLHFEIRKKYKPQNPLYYLN